MDASIGSLCPIESLPSYLQPLVALSPLRFLTDALKQLTACAPALYPLGLNVGMGCLSITMQRAPEVWTPNRDTQWGQSPSQRITPTDAVVRRPWSRVCWRAKAVPGCTPRTDRARHPRPSASPGSPSRRL